MQTITVIAMGKVRRGFMQEGCEEYIKRLKTMCSLKVIELDDEPLNEKNLSWNMVEKALDREADRIIAAIPKQSYVISLCIEGKMISSEELASLIRQKGTEGYPNICFIIGSSHGLSERVKQRSDFRMSFSRMTFPHQLFRVMLLEQIYRALSINAGTKYHK